MKTALFLITVILILLFAACVPTSDIEPANNDLLDVATVAVRPSATATPFAATPTPPPLPTNTPTIDPTVLTTTPWPPDPLPSPTPVPPFPGMVYTTNEGLWTVTTDWQPELLFNGSGVLEPDGRRLLYVQDGDIWLRESSRGGQQNLTNSAEIIECCPIWWPDLPSHILYSAFDPSSNSYYPVSFDLMTQEAKTFVAPETIIDGYAPIPNREVVLLTAQNSLFFSDTPESNELVEALLTNLPADSQIQHIYLPTQSTGGNALAVIIEGQFPGVSSGAVLVIVSFDWQSITPFFLENVAAADTFLTAQISPTGEWIVLEKFNPERAGNELNIIRIDGQPGRFTIEDAASPMWSPDGHYLVYQTDEGTFLTYPPDFTYKIGVYLPPGANLVSWQE